MKLIEIICHGREKIFVTKLSQANQPARVITRATCGSQSLGFMSRYVIKILQLHHSDRLCESEAC